MAEKLSEAPKYSVEDFKKLADDITSGKKTDSKKLSTALQEGIKKDPQKACKNFYEALSGKGDKTLLSATICLSLQQAYGPNNVYFKKGSRGPIFCAPEDKFPLKGRFTFLDSIGIMNADDARNVKKSMDKCTSDAEGIIKNIRLLLPKEAITTTTKAEIAVEKLSVDIRTPTAPPIRTGGGVFRSWFGDNFVTSNIEGTYPLIGIAAGMALMKFAGIFDFDPIKALGLSEEGGGHGHEEGEGDHDHKKGHTESDKEGHGDKKKKPKGKGHEEEEEGDKPETPDTTHTTPATHTKTPAEIAAEAAAAKAAEENAKIKEFVDKIKVEETKAIALINHSVVSALSATIKGPLQTFITETHAAAGLTYPDSAHAKAAYEKAKRLYKKQYDDILRTITSPTDEATITSDTTLTPTT